MRLLAIILLLNFFCLDAFAAVRRYAVIENQSGMCVNSVLWDGKSTWTPPAGCSAIIDDSRQIDDQTPPPTQDELDKQDKIQSIETKLAAIGLTDDEVKILTGDSK